MQSSENGNLPGAMDGADHRQPSMASAQAGSQNKMNLISLFCRPPRTSFRAYGFSILLGFLLRSRDFGESGWHRCSTSFEEYRNALPCFSKFRSPASRKCINSQLETWSRFRASSLDSHIADLGLSCGMLSGSEMHTPNGRLRSSRKRDCLCWGARGFLQNLLSAGISNNCLWFP